MRRWGFVCSQIVVRDGPARRASFWSRASEQAAIEPVLHAVVLPDVGPIPGAILLRENRARRLFHVTLSSGGMAFLKVYLRGSGVQGVFDTVSSRAMREGRVLAELEGLGLPVPRPLGVAVASDGPIAGALLTGAVRGAEPLQHVLERAGRELRGDAFRERRALLRRLGGLALHLSSAGWRHRDLHAGNILLSPPRLDGDPHVVDWQRARRGKGIPLDLVDLVYSISLSLPLTEQLYLLRAGLGGGATRERLREACGRVRERKRRHLASRTSRCMKDGTEFAVSRTRACALYRQRTIPEEWIREALAEHDALEARAELVKDLPDRKVSRLQLPGPGAPFPVYVKEYVYGRADRLVNRLRGSPARCAWVAAHGLRWRGIRTPEALALVEERGRSLIVSRGVSAASPLHVVACEAVRRAPAEKREWIARLARWVRRLHDEGVYHPDLKANNVLAEGSGEFWLIDLDRTRFVAGLRERQRLLNLAQLNAAVPSPVSRADRLRFLRVYLRGRVDPALAGRLMQMTIDRKHLWPEVVRRPR